MISPQIKPNTQGNNPPNPFPYNSLLLPFAISQPHFWKVSKSPQPTLPNAQWHLIIAMVLAWEARQAPTIHYTCDLSSPQSPNDFHSL